MPGGSAWVPGVTLQGRGILGTRRVSSGPWCSPPGPGDPGAPLRYGVHSVLSDERVELDKDWQLSLASATFYFAKADKTIQCPQMTPWGKQAQDCDCPTLAWLSLVTCSRGAVHGTLGFNKNGKNK